MNLTKNKSRLQSFFLATFLLFGLLSSAQPPLETIVHLDKSFYVSGEVIWFKLYLPATWKGHDVAIKTTVLDADAKITDRFFIKSEGNNFIDGYHKTAFDAPAGIYEIQFSASAGANAPEQLLAYYQIPIYNDLEKTTAKNIVSEIKAPKEISTYGNLNIAINSTDQSVKSRSEISVNISVTDDLGNPVKGLASVSVKDAVLAKSISGDAEIMKLPLSYAINPSLLQNEIYARGKITTADGAPLQINVLGGYVGSDEKIYYSKSNNEGDYNLNLPDFTGTKKIQFLGFQYERLDLRSSVEKPQLIGPKKELIYSEEIKDYLALSKMRKKIFQHYESFETDLEPKEIVIDVNPLKADATYSVKEYESFKDLKSFFGELMTPLRFKLEKDSLYTASLYNPNGKTAKNTELNGPPLFIVDGKVTRNADWVARLPISAVETVELFLNAPVLRSYYQAIGVSGVVKIYTTLSNLKLPDADASNIHDIVGLQAKAQFPVFNPSDISGTHQPFFRPQLYWNPALESDDQGNVRFSFFQSDDTGEFEIKVVFQAEDGRSAIGTYRYQVEF
jgi:hypothetical protein